MGPVHVRQLDRHHEDGAVLTCSEKNCVSCKSVALSISKRKIKYASAIFDHQRSSVTLHPKVAVVFLFSVVQSPRMRD